jgi:hypothetical protein
MTLTLSGKVTVTRLYPDKSTPAPAPAAPAAPRTGS